MLFLCALARIGILAGIVEGFACTISLPSPVVSSRAWGGRNVLQVLFIAFRLSDVGHMYALVVKGDAEHCHAPVRGVSLFTCKIYLHLP